MIIFKLWRQSILFYIGGCAYVGLELLWRGWSHPAMFLAGGLCLVLFGQIRGGFAALKAAGIITAVELAFGLTVNRSHSIWDYSARPGNFLGQICPLFCLLWIPVGALGIALHRLIARRLP